MKDGYYESRAEQLEADVRRLLRKLGPLTRPQRAAIRGAMRDAALLGIMAERDRVIELTGGGSKLATYNVVIQVSVKDVMGIKRR